MRRRFQIGMGVNPSLMINKGIYIQHVDGGLYTKENWSNKGYSNDLCNGIALVDKVCFVIATEYIGTFSCEINECLLMVGGTIMSNKMWTSTQSTQFTYS